MDCGYGGVGAGTARWLGLTPTAVRQSAGLPARQPSALVLPEVGELPRPRGVGPLVLLGGGPTPAEALQTAVELTRRPDSSAAHRTDHRSASGVGNDGGRRLEPRTALARQRSAILVEVSSGRRPEREAAHRFYAALGYRDTAGAHVRYRKRLEPEGG